MSSEDAAVDLGQQEAANINSSNEKMMPQSEVNKLVGAAKARAEADALAKYQQMQGQSPSFGGMAQMPQTQSFDPNSILEEARKVAQEEWDKKQKEREHAENTARVNEWGNSFLRNMAQGPAQYKDFDEVVADITPEAFPNVVIEAGRDNNTADIMYELGKNPDKAVRLQQMAQVSQGLFQKEFRKLAESIAANKNALAQNQKAPNPLSRLKSSVVAGSDTGKRTIKDIRKDPRFRG